MGVMVKRLSERAEFWIVLLVAYTYPFVAGVLDLWSQHAVEPGQSAEPVRVSDADLWPVILYEIAVGLLILGFLRWRGIAWRDLRPEWSRVDAWHGLGLFFGAFGAIWMAFVFASVLPDAAERLANSTVEATFSLAAAGLLAVVNALFEEGVNLGYVQSRLRSQGAAFAIGATLLVRLLPNLGHGPHALVVIVPLGLLFGIYHWRTGRLWPVILAHAMFEAMNLFAMRHAELVAAG